MTGTATARRRRRRLIDVAIVVLVLVTVGPIVQPHGAQQASRMALTAAMWDDGSIRIDGYLLGVDRAERDGHTYSDKAPGQPFLGIPAYAAYRALGGEPAIHPRTEHNLGLWAVSLLCAALPAALLALLLRRAAERVTPDVAPIVAVALIFSTMLLPFASVLFGHVLSALLAFGGWLLATRSEPSNRDCAAAGFLVGCAVLVEYTLAFAAMALAVHIFVFWRPRLAAFIAGGIPAALALLLYQWAAFGSPLAFSYSSSSFGSEAEQIGLEPLDPPFLENAARVLVGERGLFVINPLTAVALAGLFVLIRRSAGHVRSGYIAAVATALSLVVVQMFWSNPTGGDSPGPRYAAAGIAFLAPGLALAWRRWPRTSVVTALLGAAVMLAATWTNPLEARDSRGAINLWLDRVADGQWTGTLYEMAGGDGLGILLPVGFALGAAGFAWILVRTREQGPASEAAVG